MSSMNDYCEFIYANESSSLYGVGVASAIGSTTRSGNTENRDIITSTNLLGTFNFHGIKYGEPLQFDVILFNLDGSWIDCNKERLLKKWMLKNSFNWFRVNQDDLSGIEFYAICKSAEMIDIGSLSGGLKCTFLADAPWAWSTLRKKTYTTVDNTLSLKLNLDLDFDKYLVLPQLTIKVNGAGNVSIKNVTTNETVSFSDCITNEIITLECDSDKLKSSVRPSLISAWNKQGLSLIQDTNQLLLTGNFTLSLEYRIPIRVGA